MNGSIPTEACSVVCETYGSLGNGGVNGSIPGSCDTGKLNGSIPTKACPDVSETGGSSGNFGVSGSISIKACPDVCEANGSSGTLGMLDALEQHSGSVGVHGALSVSIVVGAQTERPPPSHLVHPRPTESMHA